MSALAFDIQTGELIDLVTALENNATYEELAKKFADRPNAYCCAECLAREKGLSDIELSKFRSLGLAADSSFRRGCVQKRLDVETGQYKEVKVRPTFWHTTRLVDENGDPIQRPCESDTSIHHAFCRYIAGPGRGWLLGSGEDGVTGSKDPRHVITVMARYKKVPTHREPDISVLWARDYQTAKTIEKDLENGNKIIDWNLCVGLTAVEVQKSQISKPELVNRTKDHLKHFTDVRWVFTAGNKPVPPREWLAEQGMPAYIIEEEIDKSKIIGVRVLDPPRKTKTYDKKRKATFCLRSVLMYWLSVGCAYPEALARAKADVEDLKEGKHIERLSVFEQQLHEIFPNHFLDPKQIWLRHQRRQEEA
tara:strand:+ start:234 stop:1325 length:1092 start_codon:yes stop_codon:yes gene_type:complete